MFTTMLNSGTVHRGLWSAFTILFVLFLLTSVGPACGFRVIFRDEGWGGLYRGTLLALVGVSNGALQFMVYKQMKSWAFELERRRVDDGRRQTGVSTSCICVRGVSQTQIYIKVQFHVYSHIRPVKALRDQPVPGVVFDLAQLPPVLPSSKGTQIHTSLMPRVQNFSTIDKRVTWLQISVGPSETHSLHPPVFRTCVRP